MTINDAQPIRLYKNGIKEYGLMLAAVVGLMLAGLTMPLFTLGAFGICLLYVVLKNNEHSICLMFFLLPFANIFKLGPQSTSLYTYLMLVLIVKLIFSRRYINANFVFLWARLTILQAIGCKGNYTLLIKQACILLLIYGYFNSCQRITKELTFNMAYGLIVSCLIGLMSEIIPGLGQYMRIVKAYEISANTYRFTGLYTDPNFLSVSLILISLSIIILAEYNEIKKVDMWMCIPLLGFGILTISKSFFLMLIMLVLLYSLIMWENHNYKTIILLAAVIAVVVLLTLTGKITIFNSFIDRFKYSNDISTGRFAILANYFRHILSNPIQAILGFGIGARYVGKNVPHNTLIDFIYYYGVLGSFFFCAGLNRALRFGKTYKKIGNIAPAICVLVMFMALSALQMYDFPFVLILALDYMRYPLQRKRKGI